jgi:hypothetical protein
MDIGLSKSDFDDIAFKLRTYKMNNEQMKSVLVDSKCFIDQLQVNCETFLRRIDDLNAIGDDFSYQDVLHSLLDVIKYTYPELNKRIFSID